MTGLQGIVDAGANVVHASSRGDVDGERKQALDEALLDNGLFGELGFLIQQGDDDLGQIGGVGQNLVVSAVNIDGQITHGRLNICFG